MLGKIKSSFRKPRTLTPKQTKERMLLLMLRIKIFFIWISSVISMRSFVLKKNIQGYATIKASKIAGTMFNTKLPEFLRPIICKLYINAFKVNEDDILNKDFKSYKSLNEFFIRKLDLSRRPFDSHAKLVSPCDGKVLSFTKVINNSQMIVVKNRKYSLSKFLFGKYDTSDMIDSPKSHDQLYQLTIYLSPADYHRYHSPADLKITDRIYIPGSLNPVKPSYVSKHPDTFIENERVTLKCNMKQTGDPLYITYVGALNVGSIHLNYDNFSNCNHKVVGEHVKYESTTDDKFINEDKADSKTDARMMDEMGHFKFGSTIVMVFPLKEGEMISDLIKPGQSIKLGSKIL